MSEHNQSITGPGCNTILTQSATVQANSDSPQDHHVMTIASVIIYQDKRATQCFNWFANAPNHLKLEVMKRINPAPYKKLNLPAEVARLQALVAAIDAVRSNFCLTNRKNYNRDLEPLAEAHELRVAFIQTKKQRKSVKKEQVALHAETIQQLLAEGLSWRAISSYLQRFLLFKINHVYLRHCCINLNIAN